MRRRRQKGERWGRCRGIASMVSMSWEGAVQCGRVAMFVCVHPRGKGTSCPAAHPRSYVLIGRSRLGDREAKGRVGCRVRARCAGMVRRGEGNAPVTSRKMKEGAEETGV